MSGVRALSVTLVGPVAVVVAVVVETVLLESELSTAKEWQSDEEDSSKNSPNGNVIALD